MKDLAKFSSNSRRTTSIFWYIYIYIFFLIFTLFLFISIASCTSPFYALLLLHLFLQIVSTVVMLFWVTTFPQSSEHSKYFINTYWVTKLFGLYKEKKRSMRSNWCLGGKYHSLQVFFEPSNNTESYFFSKWKTILFYHVQNTGHKYFRQQEKNVTSYGKHWKFIIWWLHRDLIIPTSHFQALFY